MDKSEPIIISFGSNVVFDAKLIVERLELATTLKIDSDFVPVRIHWDWLTMDITLYNGKREVMLRFGGWWGGARIRIAGSFSQEKFAKILEEFWKSYIFPLEGIWKTNDGKGPKFVIEKVFYPRRFLDQKRQEGKLV